MKLKSDIEIDLDENILTYIDDVEEIKNTEKIDIEEYIKKIVSFALNEQKITADKVYISIQSATKEQIKEINKKYRNIDKATDVLSFPIFERDEFKNMVNENDKNKKLKEIELGDIILCLDVIKAQSIEYNTGYLRELLYMITHGVCHLLGFDHIEENDKKEMRHLEEKILNYIGVGK